MIYLIAILFYLVTLTGMVVTLLWSEAAWIQTRLPGAISGLDAVLPAIILSVLALVGVSLATSRPPETETEADG